MSIETAAPFAQFFDLAGKPLDAGMIYYGIANQNAETVPQTVYWDAAGTIIAAQPIRTLGGYVSRNGTPATVYINAAYSQIIRDKNGLYVAQRNMIDPGSAVGEDVLARANVATAKADLTLQAGDVVRTSNYTNPYDGGGWLYDVLTAAAFAAIPDGFSDHYITGNLLVLRLQRSSIFVAEQYGVSNGAECSARLNKCAADALTYNANGVHPVRVICSSAITIKDSVTFGAASAANNYNIDLSGSVVDVVAGGNISLTVPAFVVSVQLATAYLPTVELHKLGAGFKILNSRASNIYGPEPRHFIGYGTWVTGATGGGVKLYDSRGYEWNPTDDPVQFNIPASFLYSTLICDAIDCHYIGGAQGWAKTSIEITTTVANNRFSGIHPFQGNPLAGQAGQFPRIDPVCIDSSAVGVCHFTDDCYIDNGLIQDRSARLRWGPHIHLIDATRVTITGPKHRISFAAVSPIDDRSVLMGQGKPPAVYLVDMVTPDPEFAYLEANSVALGGPAAIFRLWRKLVSVFTSTDGTFHETTIVRGTENFRKRWVINQGAVALDVVTMVVTSGVLTFGGALRSIVPKVSGYFAGSGGIVVQATSRTTAVTLDTPAGRITLVSAAGSATPASFTFNNALIGLNDGITLTQNGGTNPYVFLAVKTVGAGVAQIWFWSASGTAVDQPSIEFQIHGGATS